MDRLESLGNQLSQITMYDIKSMYNQAKNIVLNVSEMESKVREATNDDAWGASSTLMQEIAQGTFNFQQFNEIMPCIYARFMEKEARQWRQIYKALQLLEYIIKHGSERVVDDARAHLSTVKMLRNFHYIDEKGKDQGINIRNRSRELAELLQDVEKIRQERRKAKANRNKYTGTGNDGSSFSGGSGGRYGGFGSESASSGGGYSGDTGGYSGSYDRDYGGSSSGFRDQTSQRRYDEYDAGDDEGTPRRSTSISQPARRSTTQAKAEAAPPPPPAASKAKDVDLLGGFDDDSSLPSFGGSTGASALDDDFDDFQTAPTSPKAPAVPAKPLVPAMPTTTTAAKPATSIFSLLDAGPSPTQPTFPAQTPSMAPMGVAPARPVYSGTSIPSYSMNTPALLSPTAPTMAKPPLMSTPSSTAASKPASTGAFDDLWSMSLGSAASKPAATPSTTASNTKSMMDLQREKAQSSIWGQTPAAGSKSAPNVGGASNSGGFGGGDDLLL